MHTRSIQAQKDSVIAGEEEKIPQEYIHVQETLAHGPHAFYLHSPKAARQLSPEFWSIHCKESMCAFRILQIC